MFHCDRRDCSGGAGRYGVGRRHRTDGDRSFTFVGWKEFTCKNEIEGDRMHRVAMYRAEAFAKALGIAADRWAHDLGAEYLDTEFVLLPPDGKPTRTVLGSPASC